jgi:nitrous-oxide reductase
MYRLTATARNSAELSFIELDPETGMMNLDFQILVPPYNYDLGRAGKGQSADWVFFTTYNTEEAHTLLEVNASRNDKDYVAAINWRKAAELVRNGAGETMSAEYYHNYYEGNQGIAINDVKDQVTVLTPEDDRISSTSCPHPNHRTEWISIQPENIS